MSEGPNVEYVGPFDVTLVVVNGRQVPYLQASYRANRVSLTLDQRFGLDLTVEEAERVVPFLAEAIAVGMGYASFGGPLRPAFPRMTELGGVEPLNGGSAHE